MNCRLAMNELKKCGTAQNRKVYARHGINEPMFGVSYANLKALAKKIGKDHELAVDLWTTGNHDARILATMIGEPEKVDAKLVESWAKDLDNYAVTDALGGLAGRAEMPRKVIDKWSNSKDEWFGQLGWNLITRLAMNSSDCPDSYFKSKIGVIEKKIHKSKNRTRYSMNGSLIAIGMRSAILRKEALAAAKRIGKVEVDHGETGCKTPDAADYIKRAAARKKKK